MAMSQDEIYFNSLGIDSPERMNQLIKAGAIDKNNPMVQQRMQEFKPIKSTGGQEFDNMRTAERVEGSSDDMYGEGGDTSEDTKGLKGLVANDVSTEATAAEKAELASLNSQFDAQNQAARDATLADDEATTTQAEYEDDGYGEAEEYDGDMESLIMAQRGIKSKQADEARFANNNAKTQNKVTLTPDGSVAKGTTIPAKTTGTTLSDADYIASLGIKDAAGYNAALKAKKFSASNAEAAKLARTFGVTPTGRPTKQAAIQEALATPTGAQEVQSGNTPTPIVDTPISGNTVPVSGLPIGTLDPGVAAGLNAQAKAALGQLTGLGSPTNEPTFGWM